MKATGIRSLVGTAPILLALLAAGGFAKPPEKTGQVGKHFAIRYPAAWSFDAKDDYGFLFSPAAGNDADESEDLEVAVVLKVSGEPADPGDARQVLKAAGGLPPVGEKRMLEQPRQFQAVEGPGAVHTWGLLDDGELEMVVRVYAIPLRQGGTAILSASAHPTGLGLWRRALEEIAASVTSRLAAGAPVAAAPASSPPAPVVRPGPVKRLSGEEIARLEAEWRTRLTNRTWAAARKRFQLQDNGRYEYETAIAIAGLGDSGSLILDQGTWRINASSGEPHLELKSANGRVLTVKCELRGGVIVIDGDVVTAK